MSKRGKTEYVHKCECVIRGRGKKKKLIVQLHQIVTVPHCYPSVVLNTLEISIEVSVRIEVQFIVNTKGTHAVMRGSTKVNATPRTKVTAIVTGGAMVAMGLDAVVKAMRGTGCSISLIDVREAMCSRRGYMDMRTMRGSRSRSRRESRTRSNT